MGSERGHRAGGTTSIDTRIIESTPDGFWMSDESGRILEVNEVYCRMTGYSREELLSSFVWDLEANESPEEVRRHTEYVREHGGHRFETRHRRRDGTVFDVEVSVAHYPGTDGGFFSFVRDITERKVLEQQREQIIEERTALMRELNHRTKNNLAIVSSLITLKDNALGDTADLSDIRHQVEAIRIVHEKLQQSPENITHINLKEYVGDILRSVFALAHGGSVRVENRIGEVMMPTKSAVTFGLIINELATNALKYAFADDRENHFTVELGADDDRAERTLVISNTGALVPDGIDLENPSSLGLQLVTSMVRQMGGSISLARVPHTSFTIIFPSDTK